MISPWYASLTMQNVLEQSIKTKTILTQSILCIDAGWFVKDEISLLILEIGLKNSECVIIRLNRTAFQCCLGLDMTRFAYPV